jgi:hypothetical protein
MQNKNLWILAVTFFALAFALRAIIPDDRFLPGGWPLGGHWYRTNWVTFWAFLIAGIAAGIVACVRVMKP